LEIRIKGARENNLKNIDVNIGDGLTVVTGISGSGKTSLVFDTIYQEARRRFLEVFSLGSPGSRLRPPIVNSITGLGPAVAVGQNLLNRNPNSTLATYSGLHPFLRILYSRFGERSCPLCGTVLSVSTEDEIVEFIKNFTEDGPVQIYSIILRNVKGSHATLLNLLGSEFGISSILVDDEPWDSKRLDPSIPHEIEVQVANLEKGVDTALVREAVNQVASLGSVTLKIVNRSGKKILSRVTVCIECGFTYKEVEPVHFNQGCPHCKSMGCDLCGGTGLHPQASTVRWHDLLFPELLKHSVTDARLFLDEAKLPSSASRLIREIEKRLEALERVGLGYISLNRPSPSLSRGESQRVRLAVALTSQLEDILHVLDEPTIGQHPHDVARFIPVFRELAGPVIYVEHDRVAASYANYAIDLGPGAGVEGGDIIFRGSPSELWKADTPTGRFFSLRDKVEIPQIRPEPTRFISFHGVHQHNLKDIDVEIPLQSITVITGVSGSGKSTLVEHVIFPSLKNGRPIGCESIDDPKLRPILVDQSPIGRNPRSNPATYTKLSDIIRDYFASETGLSPSHFSFNRPEGACPRCKGMGAIEVKMRYLPSTWITCSDCGGLRFSDEVLSQKARFGDIELSISEFYDLSISEALGLLEKSWISTVEKRAARRMLKALEDIGLGYLKLGQPSPTLSGGEAQRVKLAKYLGRRTLSNHLLILDEPSTGLHPHDISGLLVVLDRLVRAGATIIVVEHNSDIIRTGDWIIDLGPGAGPKGGQVIYSGPYNGLFNAETLTGYALRQEDSIKPSEEKSSYPKSSNISIRGARANNLKGINIDFPKGAFTVVTGVSGSGKSSLVSDVLETEARRRFLETLSMYERQGIREGPEAPVDSITGLGVSVTVTPARKLYDRRSTIGTATEIC
jgi:excinuclease ABC subunit A